MTLLHQNQRSQAQYQQSQEKSQVWTVGMCFLEMVLMSDVSEIYDFAGKSIETGRLR